LALSIVFASTNDDKAMAGMMTPRLMMLIFFMMISP
jgi:hypothetical protein